MMRDSLQGQGLIAMTADDFLGQGRRLRYPGNLLLMIAFMLLAIVMWAAFAQVDRVVQTQGRVVSSGRPQIIQHLEGGIITSVGVAEGERVRAGQTLMLISNVAATATLAEKRTRLAGLDARIRRLQAEADGRTSGLPSGEARSVDAAASTVDRGARSLVSPTAQGAIGPDSQWSALIARRDRLRESLRIYEQQSAQRRQELQELDNRRKGLARELDLAQQQLQLVQRMQSRDAASQMELLDARARVERLTTQLGESESAVPRLKSAVEELNARAAEALAQFRSEARTALADAEIERQRLQQEMEIDDDRANRTRVTAPVDGVVNKLFLSTVGGVVRPGEMLMEITPTAAPVYLETRVAPADRGFLREGLSARIKLGPFDYTQFGTLPATVQEISADSLADERGERYFRVGLVLDGKALEVFPFSVTPGITLTADIVVGRRTVLHYILSPMRGLAMNAFQDAR